MRYDDILYDERFNIFAISFVVSHLKGTFVCSFEFFLNLAQPNTSRYKPLISLPARALAIVIHGDTYNHYANGLI